VKVKDNDFLLKLRSLSVEHIFAAEKNLNVDVDR
jgi:hypothetical protein